MSQPVAMDYEPEKQAVPPIPPPPGADLEGGAGRELRPASLFRGLSDIQKWKKDDWTKKGTVVLRGMALLFSFISFMVMVTNLHDYGLKFNHFEEYNYLLAIAILAMAYTAAQTGIKIHDIRTGNDVLPPEVAAWVDFFSDQVMAYLLISSASAATPITDKMRQNHETQFGDQAAAAISMSFLAFFSLAPAAFISGYHLSTL